MQITGFSIIGRDDGREVTISFLIPGNAELEDSDILAGFNIACEIAGVSRDTIVSPKGRLEAPGELAPAPSQDTPNRRGSTSALAAANQSQTSGGGTARKQADPTPAGAASTPSTGSAGPRKRGSSGTAPNAGESSPQSSTGAGDALPVSTPSSSGPRKRGATGPATPGESATTAGASSAKATTTTASPSEEDEGLTDADLSRAVSNAAQKLGTPKSVMEYVVKNAGGPNVAKVPQEKRVEFLAGLRALSGE